MRSTRARTSVVLLVGAAAFVGLFSHRAARATEVRVVAAGGGQLELRREGAVIARYTPRTPAANRGPATVREVSVAERRVIEVSVPVRERSRREVWLGELVAGGARPVWTGVVGALDADGESSLAIELGPEALTRHQSVSRFSQCDGRPVRLFEETYDWQKQAWRPLIPPLPAPTREVLEARREGAPDGAPVLRFAWIGATSSAGGRGDARRVAAPLELGDGDPASVWSAEGVPRGQRLVARAAGGEAPVVGLRIWPGAGATLTELDLVLGAGDERRFTVRVPDGRQPFWIPLPRPVTTSCVEVVVRGTTGAGALKLGELQVVTELDGPGGIARLVEDAANSPSCEARVPALVAAGESVLAPLVERVPKTAGPARVCLLEALSQVMAGTRQVPPPNTGAALAGVLEDARPEEERLVHGMMQRLPSPPVAALAERLRDSRIPELARVRAAAALGTLSRAEAARRALLSAVGAEPATVARAVRSALLSAKAPLAADTAEALTGTDAGAVLRRSELLLILGAAAGREPGASEVARPVLLAALRPERAYEERARAVEGLGRLGGDEAIAALAQVRRTDEDAVIRYLALRELAQLRHDAVLSELRAALDDRDPAVREEAARALGRRKDLEAAGRLAAASGRERWPFVRRAQIAALGDLCAPAGRAAIQKVAHHDYEEVRRAAFVAMARCRDPEAPKFLTRVLGRRPESPSLRGLSARLLGELGGTDVAREMAQALKRLLTEAQADLALEPVVVDTVRALANIGGPQAVSAIVPVVDDPRPMFKKAAIDALGALCDGGPGSAALARIAAGADPEAAAWARSAARRCAKPQASR